MIYFSLLHLFVAWIEKWWVATRNNSCFQRRERESFKKVLKVYRQLCGYEILMNFTSTLSPTDSFEEGSIA